jgi:hypothetical protein
MQVKALPQSVQDCFLNATVIEAMMGGNDSLNYLHFVNAMAMADPPSVNATSISANEGTKNIPFMITATSSADNIVNSETLSVRLTVPFDIALNDFIGDLTAVRNTPGVSFIQMANGTWMVTATGATPSDREAALNAFLNGGIVFTPTSGFVGTLTMMNGILVEAI